MKGKNKNPDKETPEKAKENTFNNFGIGIRTADPFEEPFTNKYDSDYLLTPEQFDDMANLVARSELSKLLRLNKKQTNQARGNKMEEEIEDIDNTIKDAEALATSLIDFYKGLDEYLKNLVLFDYNKRNGIDCLCQVIAKLKNQKADLIIGGE